MARGSNIRRMCLGMGAVGGTVAVLAVVIENYVDLDSRLKMKTQLLAESEPASQKYSKWNKNWDQMHHLHEDKSKPGPTARRNLILIRHGQYNLDGESDADRYLTQLGQDQAKMTGMRLATLDLPFTHIVRSRMTRAIQTADIISQQLPGIPLLPEDGILNEGSPILPEPRSSSWRPHLYYERDGARIEAAFRKYFHRAEPDQEKDSYEIIVCHANVIRYFAMRALQLPPEAWLRLSLKNGSYTWFVIKPDGDVFIRGLGESGHFPPEMLTTS